MLFARPVGDDESDWEPLLDHLDEVAELAASFGDAFGAFDWGQIAGRLHDVGKASLKFQEYLRASAAGEAVVRGSVDHATAGAQYLSEHAGPAGKLLAYVIAGHHTGLPDANGEAASLRERLKKVVEAWEDRFRSFDSSRLSLDNAAKMRPPIAADAVDAARLSFQLAFFTRMVFSALVDADSLVSERFVEKDRPEMRASVGVEPQVLLDRLNGFLSELASGSVASSVNRVRQDVQQAARAAAVLDRGFFSLTVPTGGGKTFSSLAFALEHIRKSSTSERPLRRVVYAIPFTSIIDQTTATFRKVFGDDGVLEHHGQVVRKRDDLVDAPHPLDLVAENFDHTLIVTTNVQFFESLFAHQRGRCRKLHNLANSVIILDEAQTLPVELLKPALLALRELVDSYGCTVVLCTATQPSLQRRDDFKIGLSGVREMMPNPHGLQTALKRTQVVRLGVLADDELVERLAEHEQVLCIVNSRRHAAEVFRLLHQRLGSDVTASGDGDESTWERLVDHLRDVSVLAGELAAAFGGEQWGRNPLLQYWAEGAVFCPQS